MPLALWIIGGVFFLGTVGFFIGHAAARVTVAYRQRELRRFQAECDRAQAEARASMRCFGRVPRNGRAAS